MIQQDGCHLSYYEILAVMMLAGKQQLFGFEQEELSEEQLRGKLLQACCDLMRDGLLKEVNGEYRLNQALVDVLYPVVQASTVWVFTPGDEEHAQQLFYTGENVVSVIPATYGGYVLTPASKQDIPLAMAGYPLLETASFGPDAEETVFEVTVCAQDSTEELLGDAVCLLECFCAHTGERLGWIRLQERGIFTFVQWTEKGTVQCEVFVPDNIQYIFDRVAQEGLG